jgi:uncharacterized protein YndB with AHSA1/START domain
MDTTTVSVIVEAAVKAPIEKVWNYYNNPDHITKWNFAVDDWQCPWAKSDLRVGGQFSSRMEAKDGSFGFEFGGEYTQVVPNKTIAYKMGDGRKATVEFRTVGSETWVVVTFDAENQNPIEMQKGGWQAILNNFKKYTESN